MKKTSRLTWLLPLAFALPFAVLAAVGAALYGRDILDLLMIALKLGVVA